MDHTSQPKNITTSAQKTSYMNIMSLFHKLINEHGYGFKFLPYAHRKCKLIYD